jgi:type 2 lantibiotic biosynthesis protein LanM
MNYKNEIKENATLWNKILGIELCNRLLDDEADRYTTKENIVEEVPVLALIEPYYRKALTEKIEGEQKVLLEGAFPGFYCIFIKTAYFYWNTQSICLLKNAWKDITENLYKRIEKIPIKILIQDIHNCKNKGLLIGENSEEEYEDYQKRFMEDPAYIDNLCENYLEMKRLLFLQIYQTIGTMWEIESALQRDKGVLTEQLCSGHDIQNVVRMDTSLSDCHRGGRTVAKILLDNGFTLIYKPHNLQKEILFEQIYEEFLNWCGLKKRKLHIINRGSYGWEEYIEKTGCDSIDEVERYFERTGILLFLCYIMGATDIHGENLLASGEYPMLLDLETFPGCRQQKEVQNAEQMIREEISGSVLCTGLLPVVAWGNQEAGVIVNALHKNSREMTPFRLPMVCRPKSSEIHIEYRPVEIKLSGSLPVFQNKEMNPADFEEWICKGFAKAYDCMLEQKQKMTESLERLFSYEGRYLLRHTQQYSMILNMSLFPEFLKSKEKRELFLHVLDKQNLRPSVHDYERCALAYMDIPIFYAKGRDLLDGNGGKHPEYFTGSPYEAWSKKVKELGWKDKKEQLRFIKLSLALLREQREIQRDVDYTEEKEIIISKRDLLRQIADTVCRMAVIYGEDEDINWSGLRFFDEKSWSFVPHGMYLYDGIGGVAVFLAMALKSYPEAEFERIYKMVSKKLFHYTKSLLKDEEKSESSHTGAFIGEGSVVYTYLLLYKVTQRQIYLDYAKMHSEILFKKMETEKTSDFLSGLSGAVVVLLKLYRETGEERLLKAAVEQGERIWERAERQKTGYGFPGAMEGKALAGMAHGNSGYILAFSYLLEITGERCYQERIREFLAYENSLYSEKTGNWRDLRKEDSGRKDLNAWCHGAAGILLSRMKLKHLKEFRDCAEVQRDMERCVEALRLCPETESVCLCHGLAGMRWIIGHYLKEYRDEILEEKQERLLNRILRMWEKGEGMLPQEYYQVSLMTGITGVGVALCEGEDYELLC